PGGMTDRAARFAQLSDALASAADARHMATSQVWPKIWEMLERELLERLLKCGPTDDAERYRLQTAIEVSRHLRRAIEHTGGTAAKLEEELDYLEGRKMRPIA